MASLAVLRVSEPVANGERSPVFASIHEGLRFVFGHQILLGALALDMFSVLFGGAVALLPAFMLSGFVFPLEQMPTVIQWVSYAFPARYMVTLSRAVFLKGAGFEQVWPQLAALALATVILIALSTALYSRRARQLASDASGC